MSIAVEFSSTVRQISVTVGGAAYLSALATLTARVAALEARVPAPGAAGLILVSVDEDNYEATDTLPAPE